MIAPANFASPNLIAAARACAVQLASVPRVTEEPRLSQVPHNKRLIPFPFAPQDQRIIQAARYYSSRYPKHTVAERVRFGLAHGFSAWAICRAVRVARALSRSGIAAQHRDMHSNAPSAQGASGGKSISEPSSPKVWGNEPAAAPFTFTASRSDRNSPAGSRVLSSVCVTATEPVRAAVQFSSP